MNINVRNFPDPFLFDPFRCTVSSSDARRVAASRWLSDTENVVEPKPASNRFLTTDLSPPPVPVPPCTDCGALFGGIDDFGGDDGRVCDFDFVWENTVAAFSPRGRDKLEVRLVEKFACDSRLGRWLVLPPVDT